MEFTARMTQEDTEVITPDFIRHVLEQAYRLGIRDGRSGGVREMSEEVMRWAGRNAKTDDTPMSDFKDEWDWYVDANELIDFCEAKHHDNVNTK